ncbi:alpha/beta hydrolase, partial [Alphaproteobacteria bacterium]|nr:alpha/beta hydrolase [Alphaproteobacteria bacterium]
LWIGQHIQPNVNSPLIMLSLSMGGNIGMHYLLQNPNIFTAAAFIAPMFGIKSMNAIPLSSQISKVLKRFAADSYVPGGGDWRKSMHPGPKKSILTKDPERNPVHNAWSLAVPELQIGGVTFGWVYEAHRSCKTIQKSDFSDIRLPCLIACAQHEILVDNKTARKVALKLPQVKLVMLQGSYHEPLMERDDIRNRFLKEFYMLIEEGLKERE